MPLFLALWEEKLRPSDDLQNVVVRNQLHTIELELALFENRGYLQYCCQYEGLEYENKKQICSLSLLV